MDRYDFAEKFSEALFNYLWYIEGVVSDTAIVEAITAVGNSGGDVLEYTDVLSFMEETTKTVFALSTITLPSFSKFVVDYFSKYAINRIEVSAFVSIYRRHKMTPSDDIFAVVLDTCSLIYRLFVFCRRMGHEEFVEFADLLWTQIFNEDLDDDFYARGGWGEFRKYVVENRYALENVDGGKRELVAHLEAFKYFSLRMGPELYNPKSSEDYSASVSDAYSLGAIAFGFDAKLLANVLQFNRRNSKIVKLLKEYKGEPSVPVQSSLHDGESSQNPAVDITTIAELSQACLSMQIPEGDHSSIDRNSTKEEVTTVETSTEIQEDSNKTLV